MVMRQTLFLALIIRLVSCSYLALNTRLDNQEYPAATAWSRLNNTYAEPRCLRHDYSNTYLNGSEPEMPKRVLNSLVFLGQQHYSYSYYYYYLAYFFLLLTIRKIKLVYKISRAHQTFSRQTYTNTHCTQAGRQLQSPFSRLVHKERSTLIATIMLSHHLSLKA